MAYLSLRATPAAEVTTPQVGRANLFIDTDGKAKVKTDDGSVHEVAASGQGFTAGQVGNHPAFADDHSAVSWLLSRP